MYNVNILRGVTALMMFLSVSFSFSQITLDESTLNNTVANKAEIFEDADYQLTIEDILSIGSLDFEKIDKPLDIIDFTTSRWIIRFEVNNPGEAKEVLLETARPITDRTDLYSVKNGEVKKHWKNGDMIPFEEKSFEHRKSIFPINFETNETKSFYLILESDGEVINLPLIFWEERVFYKADYQNNLFHGFYFGVLALVVFIFFFFYILLKEVSFLYYILYVAFQFLLQFSLEGFTHQYFFSDQLYLSNASVLLSAAGTVFFVILYAVSFMRIKERSLGWYKYFNGVLIGLSIITIMALFPGITRAISYPIINLLSLVGTVSIIIAIFVFKRRGYSINNAFTLGFILLIAGAVIFILGNLGILGDANVSQMALKISSGLEILALSISMAGKYKELQEEKENAQEKALINLESIVEERTAKIQEQQKEIRAQHKDMLDSIKYAQRIQGAILPTDEHVKEVIPDSFIYYQPRDIVSGDFYFVEEVHTSKGDRVSLFAAVDCTGHGVPGAFMSFLGNNYLMQSTKTEHVNTTGEALDFLNEGIFKSLKIEEYVKKGIQIRDGMDMTLCGINHTTQELYYSGAKNPILIITDASNLEEWENADADKKIMTESIEEGKILIEVKGDKRPIGLYGELTDEKFSTHQLPIHTGDIIYSYSDGYIDQFGGPRNKKFGTKRFKRLLLGISHLSTEEQRHQISETIEDWKGDTENLDDILVMGVRV
jgi:serine phosphatase RsbU (regulator of sigma subunit)